MRCPACGSDNPDSVNYCASCGQRVGEVPAWTPPVAAPAGPTVRAMDAYAAALPSGNDAQLLDPARALGWNWGGFLLPYLWLLGHGRVTLGLFFVLSSLVPILSLFNVLFYPAVGIYLGLNGYELAWRHQSYHTLEQLRAREREWMVWGFVGVVVFIGATVIFLTYFAGYFMNAMKGLENLGG